MRANSENSFSEETSSENRGVSERFFVFERWVRINWFGKIVLPLLHTILRFTIFFFISVIVYALFYRWMVPSALVQEPVYFDYSLSKPLARVNLLTTEKQWQYISDGIKMDAGELYHKVNHKDSSETKKSRFLRGDFAYTIDASFQLSRSSKNYILGKFMVYLDIVDTTGASIARSVRPVPVPYQSDVSLWLDAFWLYPLRLIGLISAHETSRVDVTLANNFWESSSGPSTETLELTLDSAAPDIASATVTIMPVLRGVTWYLWYYPAFSALLGVFVMTGMQSGIYILYKLVSIALERMSTNTEDALGSETPTSAARQSEESDDGIDEVEERGDAEGTGERVYVTGAEEREDVQSTGGRGLESADSDALRGPANEGRGSQALDNIGADLLAESSLVYGGNAQEPSASIPTSELRNRLNARRAIGTHEVQ